MTNSTAEKKPSLHYAWVIAGTGTLIIIACLGFGRFALGMLLPAMGADLGLDYARMGLISTLNFVGYLSAVVLAGIMARRLGEKRLILVGLCLVTLSMLLVSQAQSFTTTLLFYTATGFGSGAANVPIMVLVSHWFSSRIRGRAAGVMTCGSGLAIVFSGALIPWINASQGVSGWRTSWLVLASLSALITLVAGVLIKNRPSDLGLSAAGSKLKAGSPPATPASAQIKSKGIVTHLGVIYFLFGATYVIYATFIVTELVRERGFSEALAGQFWMWAGAFSIISGPLFGWLSDQIGRKGAMVIVFALHTAAYLLVSFNLPLYCVYLSVFLWGICVWAMPAIIAASVADYVSMERAPVVFSILTLFFGFGQIIGPGIAGLLAEWSQSFTSSFLMAAGMTFAALVISLWLAQPSATGDSTA